MATPIAVLPELDIDLTIGVTWILARSTETGTCTVFQVTCALQDAPRREDDIIWLGNFRYEDLLDWMYKQRLGESTPFESHILWDLMEAATGQSPLQMMAWRGLLIAGERLRYLEKAANLTAVDMAAMFPPLPRAA